MRPTPRSGLGWCTDAGHEPVEGGRRRDSYSAYAATRIRPTPRLVFGLRRALVLAGAQTQVMSLWKVDDAATRIRPTPRLVFGLRRALVLAGAQTQVMSLWKVDDAATRIR
ncbi:MAG: CHAT domain-containing protein, partial [Myxococcales bacterium]|nr:CHAT domain-containing protein [Myxococcales bacterium]